MQWQSILPGAALSLDVLVNAQARHMIIFPLSHRNAYFLLSYAKLSVAMLAVLSQPLPASVQLALLGLQMTQIVSLISNKNIAQPCQMEVMFYVLY